ncbi:MAG TPA: hypothetical protein VHO69_12355, partial [Phototrophicaceae bacterium]|nr:hypothetical protein [Phototrophicaceae bacterium]
AVPSAPLVPDDHQIVKMPASRFRIMAFGTLVAVIVYLPWLVNLPSQFGKVSSYYWLEKPGIAEMLLTVRSFLVGFLEISVPGKWLVLIGSVFVFLLLLVQALIDRRRLPADQKSLRLVFWLALFPPLLMWVVSQIQPVYLIRALLPSALLFYLALGWLFTRSRAPQPIRILIGLVVLALAGLGLYNHYTWATFPNSPFQPAAAQIRQDWQAGDVVIHLSKLSALPTVYYDRDLSQHYLRDLPGSGEDTLALPTQEVLGLLADESVAAAAGQAARVWWVMFDFAEREYEKAHRPELREALTWLNDHYTETGRWHFNDLVVIRYEGG